MEEVNGGIRVSTFGFAIIGILLAAVILLTYHCILLIPAYKYGKVDGKSGEGENICSVCLCEFKEGEDVRRLPDCLHSFHAPCIDMWLYPHSNCPLCRAEMTPSPLLPLRRSPPPGAGGLPRIGGG
ncbi:hypothetical protein AAC387_Pa09g1684 [Persea americana]